MKTLYTLALGAILATGALAQSFPTSFSAIYAPKTHKTFGVAQVDDTRGIITTGVNVPFTKIPLDLTPFAYVGFQTTDGNPGTGGGGLKFVHTKGSITFYLGGTYGIVVGDASPHFGVTFGASYALVQKSAPAAAHVFNITR